jgi:hypothetical protein
MSTAKSAFACPHCGHRLRASARIAGRTVRCAHCGGELVVPSVDGGAAADDVDPFVDDLEVTDDLPVPTPMSSPSVSAGLGGAAASPFALGAQARCPYCGAPLPPFASACPQCHPAGAGPAGAGRQRAASRTGWKLLHLGLGLYLAGLVTLLVGMTSAWIALGLGILSMFDIVLALLAVAAIPVLLIVASGCFGLSAAIILPSQLMCVGVDDDGARLLLGASLGLQPVAGGMALWLAFGSHPAAAASGMAVAGYGAWILWLLFLRRLAERLNQPVAAEEAWGVIPQSFLVQMASAGLMVGLAIFFVVLFSTDSLAMRLVFFCFSAAFFAGVLGALSRSPLVDSPLEVLLYPTGIPLLIRYVNLVSTLRRAVEEEL